MSVKYSYAEFNTYPNCLRTKHQSNTHYKIGKKNTSRTIINVLACFNCYLSYKAAAFLSHIIRKPVFAYAKTKAQINCALTAQLISAFVFATRIVQFLFFLNPKFQASGHPLCLYRLVCVVPGRKPQRPVFSSCGSFHLVFSEVRLQGCR